MGAEQPLGQAGSAISMHISLPTGAPGTLTIDPDRVEVFIRHLEQALDKLKEAYDKGRELVQVEPPGDDPFSPKAVDDIRRMAGDEPGGHLYANQRAQQVFQSIIDNLLASLVAYRENEARSVERSPGEG